MNVLPCKESNDNGKSDEGCDNQIFIVYMKAGKETSKLISSKLKINIDSLTFNRLHSIISNEFKLYSMIRIYSFYGREIVDTSDLKFVDNENEPNRILFFCLEESIAEVSIDAFRLKCFKLLTKLGEGGFGKVYLAEQRFTKMNFAIKFLKIRASLDLKYIHKEVDALKRLDHQNIIKMNSYCCLSQEKVALILEYGIGGTLGDYLKSKKYLSEAEARKIFIQILKAINYCHKNQVIHRDLKLENIIFSDSAKSKVKIIDFGVAGLFQGEINKAGSISYMAPEIVGGWNYASHPEIDIWAMGCILYELITGEKLFDGSSFDDKKEKIIKGKWVVARSISNEVVHLINKMIRCKANERISIKDCYQHPWILGLKLSDEELKENENPSKSSSCANSHRASSSSTNFTAKEILSQQPASMGITASKIIKPDIQSNEEIKDFNFNKYLRSNNNFKKSKVNRSGLITKVSKNISLFDLNYGIMKSNGKVVSHLQPIGHTKQQKQQNERIRDILYKSSDEEEKLKPKKGQSEPANQDIIKNSKLKSSKVIFPQLMYSNMINDNDKSMKAVPERAIISRRFTSQIGKVNPVNDKKKSPSVGYRQGSSLTCNSATNVIKFT